jgi:alpha-beta hydrolase superfamily lysophospholipase
MAAIHESTGELAGSDGIKIFYRQYQAESERARMVIAHGLGEHSGRYGNVIERMLPKGISVWVPDHRGHGRSGGHRGHVLNFEQYLTDLRETVDLAKKDMPAEMPCFLLGHSMGGLIALYFALRYPDFIDGLVASSPCLGMVIEVPPVKRVLGSFMSCVWPGMTMGNGLDPTKISRDQDVVSAYKSDPLVHDRVSARFFTELLATIESVNQQASTLNVPVLMQVADEDYLVNAHSSKHFFEKLTLEDKALHIYDGMYHEIYNAPQDQKKKVLDDLDAWLVERMTNDFGMPNDE